MTMDSTQQLAAEFMVLLAAELKRLGLWSQQRPSDEALASVQPFCVDTMRFEQWLQFVFIEKITLMLEQNIPLPAKFGIAAMSEQYFASRAVDATPLTQLLQALDEALSH